MFVGWISAAHPRSALSHAEVVGTRCGGCALLIHPTCSSATEAKIRVRTAHHFRGIFSADSALAIAMTSLVRRTKPTFGAIRFARRSLRTIAPYAVADEAFAASICSVNGAECAFLYLLKFTTLSSRWRSVLYRIPSREFAPAGDPLFCFAKKGSKKGDPAPAPLRGSLSPMRLCGGG